MDLVQEPLKGSTQVAIYGKLSKILFIKAHAYLKHTASLFITNHWHHWWYIMNIHLRNWLNRYFLSIDSLILLSEDWTINKFPSSHNLDSRKRFCESNASLSSVFLVFRGFWRMRDGMSLFWGVIRVPDNVAKNEVLKCHKANSKDHKH